MCVEKNNKNQGKSWILLFKILLHSYVKILFKFYYWELFVNWLSHLPSILFFNRIFFIYSLMITNKIIITIWFQGWGVFQLVKCSPTMHKSPGFNIQYLMTLDVVAHTYNPNTQEVEALGSEIQGHLQLQSTFEPAWLKEIQPKEK